MALIKSISGIRGTIGGETGNNLTPADIVAFTSAYATRLKDIHTGIKPKVIIGRDARISGDMLNKLVTATLTGMGIDVIDTGLSTTPTVEMGVIFRKAQGGIILTASHNPGNWNALKLLNDKGEFISAEEGSEILRLAEEGAFRYAEVDELGHYEQDPHLIDEPIDAILNLEMVRTEEIRNRKFKVVVDAVNSTGGIAIPALLKRLGVEVVKLYCEPNGIFPHNPEPLPGHLTDISEKVREEKADLGVVVDPDVDRLALVCEDGSMFGEEYTLVACADYILDAQPGNTCSNLSSTQALRDVTEKKGGKYFASAVGEVNVVIEMKKHHAVIGGEGNGGIIYPALHYGRDALVGVALFLSHLALQGKSATELRKNYPDYYMSKKKIQLPGTKDLSGLFSSIRESYPDAKTDTQDGLKLIFPNEWVHMRLSNTEPVMRIYTESTSPERADELALEVIDKIKGFSKQ